MPAIDRAGTIARADQFRASRPLFSRAGRAELGGPLLGRRTSAR
ncbi:hypothetical protein ABZX33_00290 [Streptomyces sp. NPDC004608]